MWVPGEGGSPCENCTIVGSESCHHLHLLTMSTFLCWGGGVVAMFQKFVWFVWLGRSGEIFFQVQRGGVPKIYSWTDPSFWKISPRKGICICMCLLTVFVVFSLLLWNTSLSSSILSSSQKLWSLYLCWIQNYFIKFPIQIFDDHCQPSPLHWTSLLSSSTPP